MMKITAIENNFEYYKYRHKFMMIEPIKKPKNNKNFKTVLKEVMGNVK